MSSFMLGREVVELLFAGGGVSQFPSPREIRIPAKGWGYAARVCRRVMTSAVRGSAAPSAGKDRVVEIRRFTSSRSS